MKKLLTKIEAIVFVCLLFAGCASNTAAQSPGAGSTATLYKRVGGYDAIAAVTDDFIGRLASAKQLARFFGGVSADSQKKLRQHVVDQLCEATGGPCVYTGRTMKTAHAGLAFQIVTGIWPSTISWLRWTNSRYRKKKRTNCWRLRRA